MYQVSCRAGPPVIHGRLSFRAETDRRQLVQVVIQVSSFSKNEHNSVSKKKLQASNLLSSASPIKKEIWTTKEKMKARGKKQGPKEARRGPGRGRPEKIPGRPEEGRRPEEGPKKTRRRPEESPKELEEGPK
jgi:hypothetical protein